MRSGFFTRLMLALMLAVGGDVTAHENVPGHPVQVHPIISPAQAAFDKLFWDIDDGVYPINSSDDALALLDRLKRAVPPGDVHRELQHRYMYCLLAFQDTDPDAVEYARNGAAAAAAVGDEASEAALRLCAGLHLVSEGDHDAARTEFDRAEALARHSYDFNVQGLAMVQRGQLRIDIGEVALGLQDLLEAQDVFEEGKVAFQVEFNLLSIAQAYRRIGDFDKAAQYLERVLAFGRARDDSLVVGATLVERGRVRKEQGRYAEAEADLREALSSFEGRDNQFRVGSIHLDLADVYNLSDRPDNALQAIAVAIAAYDRADSAPDPGQIDFATGLARARLGQHQVAVEAFDRALPALVEWGDTPTVMLAYQARAVSREALGDKAGALQDLRTYGRMRRDASERIADQRVLALSHGFDARYQDLINARLLLEQDRTERLAAAERRKTPWRWASIGFGVALLVLLSYLATRQARRMLGLRRMASTDPLTGAANRRAIQYLGAKAVNGKDAPAQACFALLDLDHFKQVNDRFGHAVGDQVLIRAVDAWSKVLREGDHLGRLGGEEFLVVLPGAAIGAGMQVAERLLAATRAMDLSGLGEGLQVTVTIGVAVADPVERTLDRVLARADAALYRAKENGRDRIMVADPAQVEEPCP